MTIGWLAERRALGRVTPGFSQRRVSSVEGGAAVWVWERFWAGPPPGWEPSREAVDTWASET